MYLRVLTIVVLLTLNGCASTPKPEPVQIISLPTPPVQVDAFANDFAAIESLQDVFTLTLEQQNHFFDFYHSDVNKSRSELDRIYNYLEARMDNFNYHSGTLIARDVLDKNTGNCLSLAIITKSLADLLGIKVRYELVETPTIFQKEENIILNYRHVRSVLVSDLEFMRVDYFPSRRTHTLRNVPEIEFFAMFYNNKAVEAMLDNDINLANSYLMESLKLMPANAEAISMMGVLHGRLGLITEAEKLFQYGLIYSSEYEVLLKNYHSLLIRSNRIAEADEFALKLAKYDNPDPYSWIQLADDAYQDQNYKQAIVYYRKAAKMANYLHEPYAGIARAKYHLGKNKAASKSILKALTNSHNEETTRRYQSKYEFFQAMLEPD